MYQWNGLHGFQVCLGFLYKLVKEMFNLFNTCGCPLFLSDFPIHCYFIRQNKKKEVGWEMIMNIGLCCLAGGNAA